MFCQLNLVCENAWVKKLSVSMVMLGMGVGGMIGGYIADR